jgi:hypothetical protein
MSTIVFAIIVALLAFPLFLGFIVAVWRADRSA